MAARNFPGPNVNETVESDPLMIRRPPDHMDIGARPKTLSSTYEKGGLMGIKHIGDQNATTKK